MHTHTEQERFKAYFKSRLAIHHSPSDFHQTENRKCTFINKVTKYKQGLKRDEMN